MQALILYNGAVSSGARGVTSDLYGKEYRVYFERSVQGCSAIAAPFVDLGFAEAGTYFNYVRVTVIGQDGRYQEAGFYLTVIC